jgi:hypothetical protein
MSRNSKLTQKLKRLAKKRAKKAANRSHYQELARLGQNSKSKRALSSNRKKKRANFISHPEGRCGNIECKLCNPR